MAVITIPGMFLTGDHASRPAATAVGDGSIYSCSTHALLYQSDGATWSTWATLGTAGGYSPGGTDVAVADGGTGASSAGAARTNLGLVIGTDVQAFAASASQAEMEAGTEAALRAVSPLRVAQAIAALGGGGGSSANTITQYKNTTGSPPASLVWDSAPASGSTLLIWGANNGGGPSAMSSTNTTWTKRVTDSVGGVGDLWCFEGAVAGGAGGTTVTFTGGGGGGSALGVELPSKVYSSVSKTHAQNDGNKKDTATVACSPAQFVIAIANTSGGAPSGPCALNIPYIGDNTDSINALAGGWGSANGYPVRAHYPTGATWMTIAVFTFV